MRKFSKKKVTLELSGNAANIIDEDPPDLEFAVSRNCWGPFIRRDRVASLFRGYMCMIGSLIGS